MGPFIYFSEETTKISERRKEARAANGTVLERIEVCVRDSNGGRGRENWTLEVTTACYMGARDVSSLGSSEFFSSRSVSYGRKGSGEVHR